MTCLINSILRGDENEDTVKFQLGEFLSCFLFPGETVNEVPLFVLPMIGKTKSKNWEEVGYWLSRSNTWRFPTSLSKILYLAAIQRLVEELSQDYIFMSERLQDRYILHEPSPLLSQEIGEVAKAFERQFYKAMQERSYFVALLYRMVEDTGIRYDIPTLKQMAYREPQILVEGDLGVRDISCHGGVFKDLSHERVCARIEEDPMLHDLSIFFREDRKGELFNDRDSYLPNVPTTQV